MRDLLLAVIVLSLCAAALVRQQWGLYGYLWFALLRPDIMAYSPASRPYSLALAIATLISSIRSFPAAVYLIRNPFVVLYGALQTLFLISVFLAESINLSLPYYIPFLQMTIMCFLIPLLVQHRDEFRLLFLVQAFALGLLGTRFGLWGLLRGGVRFVSGYGGSIGDNNVLALALAMVIPLCWYAIQIVERWWLKAMFGAMAGFTVAAVVFCHSRGGTITLGVVLLLLALRSQRKLLATVALLAVAVPVVYLVRDTLLDRMATLDNYEDDASAAGRIVYWTAALRVAADYPVFGVGFGGQNWVRESNRYLEGGNPRQHFVHNNYLQMLVDSGAPALAVFLILIGASLLWLNRQSNRFRTAAPELRVMCHGLQVSLVGFLAGSMFLSRVSYDFIYILLMTVAAMHNVTRELEAAQPVTATEPTLQPVAEAASVHASPAGAATARPGGSLLQRRRALRNIR